MGKYKIIDIRRNIESATGGILDQTKISLTICTITYEDDAIHYLTLSDLDYMMKLYLAKEDIHNIIVSKNEDNFFIIENIIDKYSLWEIDGDPIYDYTDFYLKWLNNQNDPFLMLIDYLIGISKVDEKEFNDLVEFSKNKYIEDLPVLDNEMKEDRLLYPKA